MAIHLTEDSDLVCSRELARELIDRLVNGMEPQSGEDRPFYIFSAEKRRVRIRLRCLTVLPGRNHSLTLAAP